MTRHRLFFSILVTALISSVSIQVAQPQTEPKAGFVSPVVGEWDFTPVYVLPGRARNLPGLNDTLTPPEQPMFKYPAQDGVLLFGKETTDRRTGLVKPEETPQKEFTVELWLIEHVNQPVGALAGVIGNRDEPETGWSAGFYNGQAFFSLASESDPSRATVITRERVRAWKKWWYHIVGTYDGTTMKLYVNGVPAGESKEESGVLKYASRNDFEVSAYLDSEPLMKLGNIVRSVRLDHSVWTEEQVAQRFWLLKERTDAGRFVDGVFQFTAGPILQMVKKDGITIVWETDQPATAVVEYGEEIPYSQKLEINEAKTLQEVKLEGLKENTPYFYRITVTNGKGEPLDSGQLTFQTAVPDDGAYSFFVIGDTEARPHISAKLAEMAWGERPNFGLVVGDLTDGGQAEHKFEWNYEYLASMTPLLSRIAVYPVVGNGESDLKWYTYYHALPEPEYYYRFSYGNADFFMLDSNQDLSPGSEQYEWLKRELPKSTATWKIAAHHHPTYSSDDDDYGDSWRGVSFRGDKNVQSLLPVYEANGVDVVWFGHLHTYERSHPVKGGKVDMENGVVHIQTGGAGGNLEDAAPSRSWFTAKFYRGHHYCLVNIHKNVLNMKMYDIEGRLRDTYEIRK